MLTRTVLGISQVKLNWTDNATNETGFQIERSLSAGSGFVLVATLPSNTTTYTQSGLNVATTYYFRVRAINAAGNSNYTSTVSALTASVTVNGSATEWSGVTALATAATGITSLKAASNATYLFLIAQGTINTNYNVLLNTDNNTATGYQGNWTSSGCDYLVQNGTLHKYNGTGSNWSWTTTDVTQTGIQHVKNASVIELRIPRASMVGMATTIKLGVETSNSSWATTALLPTAGNAQATYTFPTTAFAGMGLPLEPSVPPNLHLETRIYPNPSDGSFMLSYYAEEDNSTLTVELYSALGSLIQRITESDIALGNQQKALQFNHLEMGTYFLKSTVGMKTDVSRISVVR